MRKLDVHPVRPTRKLKSTALDRSRCRSGPPQPSKPLLHRSWPLKTPASPFHSRASWVSATAARPRECTPGCLLYSAVLLLLTATILNALSQHDTHSSRRRRRARLLIPNGSSPRSRVISERRACDAKAPHGRWSIRAPSQTAVAWLAFVSICLQ